MMAQQSEVRIPAQRASRARAMVRRARKMAGNGRMREALQIARRGYRIGTVNAKEA